MAKLPAFNTPAQLSALRADGDRLLADKRRLEQIAREKQAIERAKDEIATEVRDEVEDDIDALKESIERLRDGLPKFNGIRLGGGGKRMVAKVLERDYPHLVTLAELVSIDNLVELNTVDPGSAGKTVLAAGTAEAIRDYLDIPMQRFDTVAAAEAASVVDDEIEVIEVMGYAAAGDGGRAVYKLVGSEPLHEGKINTADGQWWELAEKVVTPLMFGATGDGTTDDTTAFQRALDMAVHVHVPRPSTSYAVSTLTLNQGQVLSGDGMFGTPLVGQPFMITGNGVDPVLQIGDGTGDPRQITIKGLSILNEGASCVAVDTAPNLIIERCRLASSGAAAHTLDMTMSYRAAIRDCHISASGGGDAIRALDNMNGMVIENNTVSGGTAGRAMQIGQSQGIRVTGNIVESSLHGIHIGADSESGNGNCNGVVVMGNYIEQCSTPLKLGVQFTISGLHCVGNYVSNQGTTVVSARTAAIQFGRMRGALIADNALYVHATEDVFWIYLVDATGGYEDVVVERNYVNGTPANVYQYQGAFAANASVQGVVHEKSDFRFKTEPVVRAPVFDDDTTEKYLASQLLRYVTEIGNDTAAITRGEVEIQRGDWPLLVGIVSTAQSLQIKGRGRPIIRWDGAAAGTLFKFRDSVAVHICDLILLGKSGAVPHSFVYSDDTDSTSGPAAQNETMVIERVSMGRRHVQDSGNSTGAQHGVYVGGPNGVNNDQFVLRDVQIHDCSVAGVYLVNAQSIWNSFENVFLDTCAKGLWAGSNIQARNLQFNRNTECDLVLFRDTVHHIIGFNAENSVKLVETSQGASASIDGGKVVLTALMTGDYWATFDNARTVTLRNWLVDAGVTSGKKLQVKAGSIARTRLRIRDCRLPDGDTRAGYELTAGAATCGVDFDIEQGSFRAKGSLDGSATYNPANIADNGTAQTTLAIAAGAGVVAGDPVLVSFSNALQGMMLNGSCYADNSLVARFNNLTGGAVDLDPGKLRWRKIPRSAIRAQASATYNPALMANSTGLTNTLPLPCKLGDFIHWGAPAYNSLIVTSYVSADNTGAIRLQNEGGGNADPASGTLNLYVIEETAFDFRGSSLVDPISMADDVGEAFTVTVPGAKVGDHAMASFSLDLQGISVSVEISADNTATVQFYNGTGGLIDLGAGVLRVGVFIALG